MEVDFWKETKMVVPECEKINLSTAHSGKIIGYTAALQATIISLFVCLCFFKGGGGSKCARFAELFVTESARLWSLKASYNLRRIRDTFLFIFSLGSSFTCICTFLVD